LAFLAALQKYVCHWPCMTRYGIVTYPNAPDFGVVNYLFNIFIFKSAKGSPEGYIITQKMLFFENEIFEGEKNSFSFTLEFLPKCCFT
jgi:hypothetical protein